jgi:DNA-binding NtrC family response regulator
VRIGDTELVLHGPDAAPTGDRYGGLVGASQPMREVFAMLAKTARSDLTVLLQGETGTGKELCAEALHAGSARADGPLVICDLAAVAPAQVEAELFGAPDRDGAFVQADGGTLLLDEIGELDTEIQPRLLRAIERRQIRPVGAAMPRSVDVRIVAATNSDLDADVAAGKFREDLFHRLAVVRVRLPPLRDRRGDIPLLVEHFLREATGSAGRPPPAVPPETMAALAAHDWPGNVRELRNVVERALSLSGGAPTLDIGVLGLDTPAARPDPVLPPGTRRTVPFKEAKEHLVEAWEREYLVMLLERANGNVSLAARRAGIARVYLHELIKKHGLERK